MTVNGCAERSLELHQKAKQLMPDGVNSPVRAFRHVGGRPIYVSRGEASRFLDEDGRCFVDYCMGWGALIMGHAYPTVVEAVQKTARDGLCFGTCHRNEIALAELIVEAFSPLDMVRFVCSGTEAVATALRLARAATQRRLLLKFSGCYHGHADAMLVKAGSGAAEQQLAESEGVTPSTIADTLVLPLGNMPLLEAAFAKHGDEIAAVIVEPLPANNGLLPQSPAWLGQVRALTHQHGALLIFDEVISGFRFGFGGYGKLVANIQPDMVTLGKIVSGGLAVGALVGSRKLMQKLSPAGGVYQAGTQAGNPVGLAAGIACLRVLKEGWPYEKLKTLGNQLEVALQKNQEGRGGEGALPFRRQGSLFWLCLDSEGKLPDNAEQFPKNMGKKFHPAYASWLSQGIYMPPSSYEVGFLSAVHTPAEVDALAHALTEAVYETQKLV
ncbi:MAG: glutamate-1-semialdehyde 2,1-aminomutase [Proteobacteria bacterium]|nr:glutamate-1-semialdehyde 2,1-aminomutase [Cystobacterineae bacterium]MCL2313842.1 glutamate-1-semialdehyde 2,1-aminomutase [Pseudomonadota bacterium]